MHIYISFIFYNYQRTHEFEMIQKVNNLDERMRIQQQTKIMHRA